MELYGLQTVLRGYIQGLAGTGSVLNGLGLAEAITRPGPRSTILLGEANTLAALSSREQSSLLGTFSAELRTVIESLLRGADPSAALRLSALNVNELLRGSRGVSPVEPAIGFRTAGYPISALADDGLFRALSHSIDRLHQNALEAVIQTPANYARPPSPPGPMVIDTTSTTPKSPHGPTEARRRPYESESRRNALKPERRGPSTPRLLRSITGKLLRWVAFGRK